MAWATRSLSSLRWRASSILTRLLLINLIVMAVPLAGFWFARLYEKQLLAGLERDMIHQAQVLRATLLAEEEMRLAGRSDLLAAISEHTGLRLRLLGADRRVLSDSGGRPVDLQARSEIASALAGRYGSKARFSTGRRRLNLFAALPIVRGAQVLGVVYASRSTAEVTRSMLHLRRHLIRIFYLSLGTTLVMTVFFAATISGPLSRLARRADAIADGDTLVPLHARGSSEIGILARSFERMRLRLQERAGEGAALAADISHEFKSPLTSIRGAAELLLGPAGADPAVRERFLHNMVEDSERMARLVGRLLELGRLQADRSPPESLDLAQLVREEANSRPSVELALPGRALPFYGRSGQLRAAVANLVENACQHAEANTPVLVRLSRSRGRTRFEVINSGQPISRATLQQMWRRFFTTRGEKGGSGLGLAIVHSAVLAHGGRVYASSSGSRTMVGFSLPG